MDWIILRTKNRHTLVVADGLAGDGIDAWSPRTKLSSGAVPIMPGIVFARAGHIGQLRDLVSRPDQRFSFFRWLGNPRLLHDSELEPLRSAEGRETPKSERRVFARGSTVRVPEGSFAGMVGKVERSSANWTKVRFGSTKATFPTFILREDVKQGVPAALAA